MSGGAALSLRSRLGYAAIGTAVITTAVAVPVLSQVQPWQPSARHYTALFSRAGQGLDAQSDVKLRGITVGGIDSVRLDPKGRVVVRLHVDGDVRLPGDTVAAVEPTSVFGPKEISLDLGPGPETGPYLADGAAIAHTRDPQEISDVARPLSQLTSEVDAGELAGLVHTLAQGLQGEGPGLRRTVEHGGTLVDQAYGHREQLRQSLVDLEQLAGTLGGRGGELTGLTGDLGSLSTLDNGQDALTRLLDGTARLADGAGGQLVAQSGDLARLLDAAGPTAKVLYQDRADLPQMLNGLNAFFAGLSSIIHTDVPGGAKLATLLENDNQIFNLCTVIRDLCPGPETPAPTP